METKYLSDGRKVVVLGKLNSQEMIVQESFVTKSGDEIPSGESFTTKSLHDEPVESYQKREEKRLIERISQIKKEIDKIDIERKKAIEKTKVYQEQLRQVSTLVKNFDESKLELLIQFMTGNVQYIVKDGYSITEPARMIDEIVSNNGWRGEFDGLKLCSIVGKSDGDLGYRVHRYSDGSGGYDEVYPFLSYEDAMKHIKKRAERKIEDGKLHHDDYQKCLEMGIVFSDEHQNKYAETNNKRVADSIEHERKEMQKRKENIEKLESHIIKQQPIN